MPTDEQRAVLLSVARVWLNSEALMDYRIGRESYAIDLDDEAVESLATLLASREAAAREEGRARYGFVTYTFRELVAVVRGEAPRLLDEDSGGFAQLSMDIDDALLIATTPDPELVVVRRADLRHAVGACGCSSHVAHRDIHLPAVARVAALARMGDGDDALR